jgi:MFS family permease
VWDVAAAVVVGLGMALLDTTIVNVALDAIALDLNCSLGAIQWVSTVYLLTLAVVIPLSGWSTERLGSCRVWTAAVTVFTAGSALCGVVVDTVSWRWNFYINVVLGTVALTPAARLLPKNPTGTTAPSLDRLGLATLAPGLAAVV